MFDKIKRFYNIGLYTAVQVYQFAKKGIITMDQYNEIVGGKSDE
jgi:uncharacterized XkdX family phage protein